MAKKKRKSKPRKKKVVLTPEMMHERARLAWNKESAKLRTAGSRYYRKEQAKWRRVTRDLLVAHGLVDKHGKIIPREPVLSEKALAYGKKIAGDKKLAIKFLKEAGIIERPGKLARPYR